MSLFYCWRLEGFCEWPFLALRRSPVFCEVVCATLLECQKTPLFFYQDFTFPQLARISSVEHTQQLLYNNSGSKKRKMSQYSIDNTTFSNNTNSFNVQNNYVGDDRSQLLAWLSSLEPRLRHQDIQERRVANVGEWLMQAEEFRSWHGWSGGGEGDKAVLFYYGGPGVGKTFIR